MENTITRDRLRELVAEAYEGEPQPENVRQTIETIKEFRAGAHNEGPRCVLGEAYGVTTPLTRGAGVGPVLALDRLLYNEFNFRGNLIDFPVITVV